MDQEPVFKPKIFIAIILLSHFISWALWSFVIMDGVEPFIVTFSDESGRLGYLTFLTCVLCCGVPFFLPFENRKQK